MTRRVLAAYRCPQCRLRRGLCVCADLPRLVTRTRVLVVLHAAEADKPSNTGRLAARCLEAGRAVVHGAGPGVEAPPTWDDGTTPVLLMPLPGAVSIETWRASDRPVTLVVPDGTWPQALRMSRRVAGLSALPCATLPEGGAPVAYLRHGVVPGRLPTMAAIARALGVLEGPEAEQALLRVLRVFVDRTLWTRGQLPTADVAGGIPPGVRQDDPWS